MTIHNNKKHSTTCSCDETIPIMCTNRNGKTEINLIEYGTSEMFRRNAFENNSKVIAKNEDAKAKTRKFFVSKSNEQYLCSNKRH